MTFEHGDLDGLAAGATDPITGNITFDRDQIEACDAMGTVFRELWHAIDVQDHVPLAEDEELNFNELVYITGYYNDQGELHEDNVYVVPAHDDAEVYGEYMSDEACDCSDDSPDDPPPTPAGTESASDDDVGDFDWAHAVVSDGGWGDGIDPDFEHAVVTTAPASESGGEAEYYEGGHTVPSP